MRRGEGSLWSKSSPGPGACTVAERSTMTIWYLLEHVKHLETIEEILEQLGPYGTI